MAGSQKASDPPTRETAAIWLPRELIQKAKTTASIRGQTLAGYVEHLVRGRIEGDYRKAIDEQNRELGESGA